ncbi:ATP-binding protein [Dankookia rubra]|uniref:ATP-binding protein n=1 Tax=Dankookia rubra TaxID=1442381 RepID=UPI00140DCB4B|nr:ATP-binding protein [Dankookia rubra]
MANRGLLRRAARAPGFLDSFRLLSDPAPEGLAVLDAEGRVLAANPALATLAGPLAALRPGTLVAFILAPAAREAFAAALAAGLVGEIPAPLRALPGDPAAPADAEWLVRLTPLPKTAGPAARLLLRVEDRTQARRAESRMAEAGRFETVGRLAGGVAHDFNNLLTAIMSGAGAVRAAGMPEAAAAELVLIEDAAKRGAALVRQLLAFARQQQLQPRLLALNEAVLTIAPLLRRLLGQAVRLELALDAPGRWVKADPTQLDQVILNLAVNARDAMPKGGTLRIATGHRMVLRPEGEGALPPGRWVVLEVGDTGDGIAPEVLPRLFEPFFTTRLDQGGTGLGLATVQGIVAQSGGHISVESRLGQGTTFRIHLPRQAAAAAPKIGKPDPPAAAPVSGAPILLVEDEAPLRLLGTRLLERDGHTVLAADSAETALAMVEAGPEPGLLVSDVAMPGADGVELACRLRQRWPAMPVLLLSGYAETMLHRDLAADGFRYLGKPFGPAELLREVTAALNGQGEEGA